MKTVTGLFDSYDDARSAVFELKDLGIPSDHISIVTREQRDYDAVVGEDEGSGAAAGAGTGAGLGALAGGAGGLLTGLGLIAIPGVGPVVAAGWLAATLAGAAAGAVAGGAAGGLIGSLVGSGVPEEEAHVYAEGVRRGSTLVTARVEDEQVAAASTILERFNRVDPAERRETYTSQGWDRFDPESDPYTDDEVVEERRRYYTPQPPL